MESAPVVHHLSLTDVPAAPAPPADHQGRHPAFSFPRLTPLLAPDVMRWINHQLLRPPEPEFGHPLLAGRRTAR
jgi:hypothetical protein